MTKFIASSLLLSSCLLGASVGLVACTQDELVEPQVETGRVIDNPYKIKDYLTSLHNPPMVRSTKAEALPNDGKPTPVDNGKREELSRATVDGVPGVWVKTTRRYHLSQAFDETVLLAPTVDILYPGCVLRGGTIADGTYAAISDCKVGDITFSINKALANDQSSELLKKTVRNIRMSDYREQFSKWASLQYRPSAVTVMHSAEIVNSEQEVAVKMGASFKHQVVDVSASLNFDFKSTSNHILAKFIQKQYSVTMDFPRTPTLFEEVDTKYVNEYAPVYVSNINYGRMVFMAIDTKHQLLDVQAALNVAVKSFNAEGNIDAKYRKVLDESHISIVAIGGGAEQQNLVLENGWEGFKKFMTSQVKMEELTPISFQMRYAVDNALARVVKQTEYDVTRTEFVPEFDEVELVVTLDGLKGSGGIYESGDLEVYGRTWAVVDGVTSNVYNSDRWHYVTVPKGGDFAVVPGSVRAALRLHKPKDMSFEEFMRKRIKFYTHFHDNDHPSADKNYGEVVQEYNLQNLIGLRKSEDPHFVIGSTVANYQVWARMKVEDVAYIKKQASFRWKHRFSAHNYNKRPYPKRKGLSTVASLIHFFVDTYI